MSGRRWLKPSPVSLNPIPASPSIHPVTRDPSPVAMRVSDVMSWNPDISSPVPLPVARIPGISSAGRRWYCFNSGGWGSNPDDYFGRIGFRRGYQGGTDDSQTGKGERDAVSLESFTHMEDKPSRCLKVALTRILHDGGRQAMCAASEPARRAVQRGRGSHRQG